MDNISLTMHSKVHNWIDAFGFRLNASQTNFRSNITTRHYFFETFNFIESFKNSAPEKSKFLFFDMYGEKVDAKTLLDLQSAFFENISQLK